MIKVGLNFCLALMHLPYFPNGKSGTGLEGSGRSPNCGMYLYLQWSRIIAGGPLRSIKLHVRLSRSLAQTENITALERQ